MTISQFPLPEGGIPTGTTAERPASPVTGDVFYNGTLGILEIYDGTNWIPCSAPPATPNLVSVTDVGTSRAFGSAQATVVLSAGTGGGLVTNYTAVGNLSGTDYTSTSSSTTITLTAGNAGTYNIGAKANNGFGSSALGITQAVALTTVPQAPTIGTATASTSANQITVTWTLGNNGGKNLTAITITPYLNGTTAQTATTAATTTATSATITGLTSGSSYTFKVKTTNANGDSAESSASNSATFPNLIEVGYLVIAGGGGAGRGPSDGFGPGGGGAGGYRTSEGTSGGGASAESKLYLTKSTNYTVTVGGGGAGATTDTTKGTNGSDSVFATITSTGGGGGAGHNSAPNLASSGGSGGGAYGFQGTGGAGTANQGYAGGNGVGGPAAGGSGGGGAGAAGAQVSSGTIQTGANGGNGVASSITGSSVTRGGGGGGGGTGAAGGTGGTGGGGNGGANNAAGDPGSVNTGGGGGGGCTDATPSNGGSGGSGVVILRWLTASGTITVGAGLTADATQTDGSFSYRRFTAGTGNVSWS